MVTEHKRYFCDKCNAELPDHELKCTSCGYDNPPRPNYLDMKKLSEAEFGLLAAIAAGDWRCETCEHFGSYKNLDVLRSKQGFCALVNMQIYLDAGTNLRVHETYACKYWERKVDSSKKR